MGDHRRVRAILVELGVITGVFMLYRSGRMFTRDATEEALRNATRVIDFERALGIFSERGLQSWALGSRALVDFLNHYYVAVHFPLTIGFLVWAYVRHPNGYRFVRTWFVVVTLAALVIHVGYPLAPPRMTGGFVDTLHEFGPQIYPRDTSRSVTNQFAAMPSLHFGWAFMLAVGFIAIKRTRASALVLAHPAFTLLAIVATGNHYWLDAIIAGVLAAVVGVVLVAARLLLGSRHAHTRPIVALDPVPATALGAHPTDDHKCPLATHSRDRCRHHPHERHDRPDVDINATTNGPTMMATACRADHPPD